MITIINVGRRCRKASGGYEKLVYGEKGVFFLYFLITHSHVLFCLGFLFFQQSLCDMYLLLSTSLQIGVRELRLEVLPAAPRPQFPR